MSPVVYGLDALLNDVARSGLLVCGYLCRSLRPLGAVASSRWRWAATVTQRGVRGRLSIKCIRSIAVCCHIVQHALGTAQDDDRCCRLFDYDYDPSADDVDDDGPHAAHAAVAMVLVVIAVAFIALAAVALSGSRGYHDGQRRPDTARHRISVSRRCLNSSNSFSLLFCRAFHLLEATGCSGY